MNDISRACRINRFHERMLRSDRGARESHLLCGWSSKETQEARFRALVRAVDFNGGTVLDYGCGTGDLYGYLARQGYEFSYIGVDQNTAMLAVAKAAYGDHFTPIQLDEVPALRTDYTFASGVFQFVDPDDRYYYRSLAAKLFACSDMALSVNFLSAYRAESEKQSDELYLVPDEVTALAISLSGRWTLDHSYHPGRGDMTVGILKEKPGTVWKRPQF